MTRAPAPGAPGEHPAPPRRASHLQAETLRFATRFRCIGSDCEDSCCEHHWHVRIFRNDYERLKRSLSGSSEDRARFAAGCVRTAGAAGDAAEYASLQRTPTGECVFLTPERLCSVQAAHGQAGLPGVCATYPRFIAQIGRRYSLTDALSCPEAARLCLLAEDAAESETAPPEAIGGYLVRFQLDTRSRDPLIRHFEPVRQAVLALLRRREYGVPSRLVFVAYVARRLDRAREVRGRAAQDAAVSAAIRLGSSPRALAALDRSQRRAAPPGALPFLLVQQILTPMLVQPDRTRLSDLVASVYAPYVDEEEGTPTVRGGDLWEAYLAQRRRWEDAFPDRVAQYVANYAASYWMWDPFTRSADLVTHVQRLLVRVAAIRFLILCHPALRAPAAPGAPTAAGRQAMDGAAVEVVYLFSRWLEHTAGARELLHHLLGKFRLRGLRHVRDLARF